MIILYTGTSCPKCPAAREVLREAAKELGLVEGKDFVEKIINGEDIKVPCEMDLDGKKMHFVKTAEEITPDKTPAALAGEDYTIEALMNQIASTPSIFIENKTTIKGRVPSKEELMNAMR